ncbi:hypothetical protein [Nostoc punctiforme]|uniref:hypothetical protein n=1 Tax=Nostoc punctiforme TaxID=272131 RepID=UPI000045BEC2|nr:hypothetical protein [Nostoc punctiforme]
MYNQYDDLSFSEQLHLTEEEIRRRHNQQMFLRRNAQLYVICNYYDLAVLFSSQEIFHKVLEV